MNHGISELLSRQRLNKGLSLSQLAARADTSPATLSRYENGWRRFELYTLRKMASALGCRLEIDLVPLKQEVGSPEKNTVVDTLKRLFWDSPLDASLLDSYPKWVTRRVLEFGTLDDARMLISYLGRRRFLDITSQIDFTCAKTAVFWERMLEKENIACTKRSFRQTVKRSWPT